MFPFLSHGYRIIYTDTDSFLTESEGWQADSHRYLSGQLLAVLSQSSRPEPGFCKAFLCKVLPTRNRELQEGEDGKERTPWSSPSGWGVAGFDALCVVCVNRNVPALPWSCSEHGAVLLGWAGFPWREKQTGWTMWYLGNNPVHHKLGAGLSLHTTAQCCSTLLL